MLCVVIRFARGSQSLKHSNTEFAEIGVFLDQELLTQRLSPWKLWRISLRLIRGGFSSKSIQPEQPLKNLRTLRKLLSAIIRRAGRVDGALMMVAFLILVAAAAMAQPQAAAPKFRPFTVQTPDGVMISAQEWGNPNGAEIVFIHGFSQSHLSWSRQVTSELANNFRMITYDIRGHGESDKPLDQAYYKDHKRWADELKAMIEGAKLKNPVLVGWSYGGRIIAEYLMEYGDKRHRRYQFRRGVYKSCAGIPRSCGAVAARKMASENLAENIENTLLFLKFSTAKALPPDELEMMLAYNMVVPAKVRSHLMARPAPYEEGLKKLKVPVLVTHGLEDRVALIPTAHYTLSVVPKARASFYESAGHMPFWENAPRFNRELAEFVTPPNRR